MLASAGLVSLGVRPWVSDEVQESLVNLNWRKLGNRLVELLDWRTVLPGRLPDDPR